MPSVKESLSNFSVEQACHGLNRDKPLPPTPDEKFDEEFISCLLSCTETGNIAFYRRREKYLKLLDSSESGHSDSTTDIEEVPNGPVSPYADEEGSLSDKCEEKLNNAIDTSVVPKAPVSKAILETFKKLCKNAAKTAQPLLPSEEKYHCQVCQLEIDDPGTHRCRAAKIEAHDDHFRNTSGYF